MKNVTFGHSESCSTSCSLVSLLSMARETRRSTTKSGLASSISTSQFGIRDQRLRKILLVRCSSSTLKKELLPLLVCPMLGSKKKLCLQLMKVLTWPRLATWKTFRVSTSFSKQQWLSSSINFLLRKIKKSWDRLSRQWIRTTTERYLWKSWKQGTQRYILNTLQKK